ncbi:MAG: nucleotide exchange factor GrpE [Acidobacteriota bacterium]|nr:nucleotide exchange factor GrpE [Acidobacteriota bacterium]MDQ3417628.1 nucleotide exchange factor GrpE [Acidobacteriota bacterium]
MTVEEHRNNIAQDPLDETAAASIDETDQAGTDSARQERDELRDLLLRKSAEFDNYRKRTERERQAVSDAITAGVVEDLLPLLDDLERALQVEASEEALPYRQGVELIQRQLADLLRKRGVKPIESLGADFDPYYHQAVSYEPAEGRREGEIIEEFRRGYMLGDRLLRPSMVKVAKG